MNRSTVDEFNQENILSILLRDSNLFSKIRNDLYYKDFESIDYQIIYKAINNYYTRFGSLPRSADESKTAITDLVTHDRDNIEVENISEYKVSLGKLVDKLYSLKLPEKNSFKYEKVTLFIQGKKLENVIGKHIHDIVDNKKYHDIHELSREMLNSLDLTFDDNESFNMANIDDFKRVKVEALGSIESNPIILKSRFKVINECMNYGGYKIGDLITVAAPPGRGKTMFLINEGLEFILQDYKVLHLFVGDMKSFDGYVRYMSNISDVTQSELIKMSTDEQIALIKKYQYSHKLHNLEIKSYPPDLFTVEQLTEDVKLIQNKTNTHFDAIIVDYPDNLLLHSDSLYERGGEIYNKLSQLGTLNKSAMFAGSQVKIAYYTEGKIGLGSLADSSKKQNCIDMMITLGSESDANDELTCFIPKNRRGRKNISFKIKTDFDHARMLGHDGTVGVSDFEEIEDSKKKSTN